MHRSGVRGRGEDGMRLQISLASPSPLKQGFPKRSLDILDSRNTSAPFEENRCKSLKLSRLWKRRLMILREEIKEPLCRMGDISEQDISDRYAATLLTICSLSLVITFFRGFSIKYSPRTSFYPRSKYPQSSIANSPVVVEAQCGSALTRCLAKLRLGIGWRVGWRKIWRKKRKREKGFESSLNNWTIIGRFAGVQTRFRKMAACLPRLVNYSIVLKRNLYLTLSLPCFSTLYNFVLKTMVLCSYLFWFDKTMSKTNYRFKLMRKSEDTLLA